MRNAQYYDPGGIVLYEFCTAVGGCTSPGWSKLAGGQSSTVVQVLPGYLHEEIIFAATQKQKLVGRIMEALGTFTLRQARDGKQPA